MPQLNNRDWIVEILDEVSWKTLPSPRYNPGSIGDLSEFYVNLLEVIYNYDCKRVIVPNQLYSKLDIEYWFDIDFYLDYLWVRGHLDRYEVLDSRFKSSTDRNIYSIRDSVFSYFDKPMPRVTNRLLDWLGSNLNAGWKQVLLVIYFLGLWKR